MARKVMVTLVDDLDGTELADDGESVEFAVDGTAYAIDLSSEHAAELRDTFGRYMEVARKVGRVSPSGSRSGHSGRSHRSGEDRERTKEIRAWAVANGHMNDNARGRIPARVYEAYEAAQRGQGTIPNSEATPRRSRRNREQQEGTTPETEQQPA